ncbi:glucose-6-phosphate dehydrogenase [Protaetiibacter mangrovi]|uniref:Glucose-6-phosphate dehydrogenase n=1 Tax=Protaetiibacter mangrovi TaxID=2970926 RepID=A0ABT1ZF60_9MICO|nr:glucose-6-phosphate dehydrogenase [Protaetiibacter mangrovi]MCS0499285.1 glucose-6-phosphate dehydrogenase [Protaetiibacter mangrovi]TPX03111.1 glucose-6-phosphate dehydrogenase [Schumannella luteola]
MGDVTTLAIIGASGDLAARLLLPALGELLRDEPGRRVRLVGAGSSGMDDAHWRSRVEDAFGSADARDALDRVELGGYLEVDATTADGLREIMGAAEGGSLVLYFAVPPQVTGAACAALSPDDLPDGVVFALEKPFGTDRASAEHLDEVLHGLLPETSIFRVDHFLGRSTVLNVIGARVANRLFEPIWSAEDVESVEIRFDESLGLEGRAGYYDHAGALVDMIQSHLLQVLAIVAMEPPATLGEVDLRDATAAVLRATRIRHDDPVRHSRRARYTAGSIDGRQLPSYVDEDGVDPANRTETLAELVCEVRTARWVGVPFTLRSGKALADPATEIVVRLRPVRHLPAGMTGDPAGAVLRFSLGPDRLSVAINVNGGEDPFELHRAELEAELGLGAQRAYAEVLGAILDGDPALTVRGDAAEECWRIVEPALDAWRHGKVPLDEYPAGSRGPSDWPDER